LQNLTQHKVQKFIWIFANTTLSHAFKKWPMVWCFIFWSS
jgi:hypothetical protein